MTRLRPLLLALAASGALLAGFPATAQIAESSPSRMIRSLQFVQDAIANGDHSALEMQRHLLQLFDERVRRADGALFDNPAERDAVIIYSMSGGNPQTLAFLARRHPEGAFDGELVQTIQTYLAGQGQAVVGELLAAVPLHQGTPIEPYLALVAANAAAASEPEAALALFDRTRLLAPGTIIEESALRRSIFIASQADDFERGLVYAERYARRFLHSPYASQFADLFVGLVLKHPDTIAADQIVGILAHMDADRRRSVYLRIARQAAIDGNGDLARLAAAQAKELGSENERVEALAGLYSGVVGVPTDDIDDTLDRIGAIGDDALSPRDRALREAARRIAASVVAPPDASLLGSAPQGPAWNDAADAPTEDRPYADPQPAGEAGGAASAVLAEDDRPVDAFVRNKRTLLENVDQLLGDGR
jgi:chemotaxis protein MotC